MRFLALILALVAPLAFAADNTSPTQPKKADATTKKDFGAGKAELMAVLEYRKKMEAAVYLSRKKILDTTIVCVQKAKDVPAILKCNDAERKQAFESIQENQKLMSEFGKKSVAAREALGLPEPLSVQEAAAQAQAPRGGTVGTTLK